MKKKIIASLILGASIHAYATNYFHIGFCNYSSKPVKYALLYSLFNNPNIFDIPRARTLAPQECLPYSGHDSWSMQDNQTMIGSSFSHFKFGTDLNDSLKFIDLVLTNPATFWPYLTLSHVKNVDLKADPNRNYQDYTILISVTNNNNIYSYQVCNPFISNSCKLLTNLTDN